MAFLTENEPPRGTPLAISPGIARIVASNRGVMTYHGTNTYLIEASDGFTVLDPGPDEPDHVRAILAATGGQVARIVLSHTHSDHLGAAKALQAATRAPTYGYRWSADPNFRPDVPLVDGDMVAGLVALHTPGHASDHLCYAGPEGIVFSADHVMSWSSSVVSPPSGNMADYFRSLERLLERDDRLYLPGHGPPLSAPRRFVEDLLQFRKERENAIYRALKRGPQQSGALAEQLYSKTDPRLKRAAERNVTAHLLKLEAEGRVEQTGPLWAAVD